MKLILQEKKSGKQKLLFSSLFCVFSFAKLSNGTMTSTINQLKTNIQNIATETINSNRVAGETNNQILALKAKHEEEKESFEVEIKKLKND